MTIVSAYKCDIGRMRKQNEDHVWVDEQAGLYIVADGMGGQEAGDVASRLATVTVGPLVIDRFKSHSKPLSVAKIKEAMIDAIETANETVFNEAQEAGQKRRMGTTIVMALVQSFKVYLSHAGDSRAYWARGSRLTQLTVDDSWGAEFGGPKESKGNSRNRIDHFLTKSIGQATMVEPSFMELGLTPGDCLLLCSDGLWDMVDETQILRELQKIEDDPTKAVKALVAAANTAGGKDNISIIIIKALP